MKALFEHNGFTRMEEIPDAKPPSRYCLYVQPPISSMAIGFGDPAQVTTKIWQFELHGIEYVDNEYVAIYKFEYEK